MRIIKILPVAAFLVVTVSCGTTRRLTDTTHTEKNTGIEMTVYPERNGGAPDALELTIKNNTSQAIQFGANYSIERKVGGQWVEHELGNFAVIAIMYGLQPGDSGKYTINLFSDRVKYPEGDYRVVKRISTGDEGNQPYYADFTIIEPR